MALPLASPSTVARSPRAPRAQRTRLLCRLVIGGALWLPADASLAQLPATEPTPDSVTASNGDDSPIARFLQRLMMAESGGRDDARNPRSTAVGPYQFIETTFLEVCRRHFPSETAGLTPAQTLALRSDRAFAHKAVVAFTLDNAVILDANGFPPSASNLRLAHLVGARAAVRVLRSPATLPVISVLGALVVQANPFMAGKTTGDLVRWSARDIARDGGEIEPQLSIEIPAGWPLPSLRLISLQPTKPAPALPGAVAAKPAKPGAAGGKPTAIAADAPAAAAAKVSCNLSLPACRRFQALAERRPLRPVASTLPTRRARTR